MKPPQPAIGASNAILFLELCMRSLAVVTLALLLSAFAGKKKTPVPAVITHARYVCILPLSADTHINYFSPNLTPQDRRVLYAVDSEVRRWKRYIVVIDPKDADIILAARAGRSATVNIGATVPDVNIGVGRRPPTATTLPATQRRGITTGVEAGPAEDTLAVFIGHSTDAASPWMHRQPHGLEGDLPLLKAFEKDVAKTDQTLGVKP